MTDAEIEGGGKILYRMLFDDMEGNHQPVALALSIGLSQLPCSAVVMEQLLYEDLLVRLLLGHLHRHRYWGTYDL